MHEPIRLMVIMRGTNPTEADLTGYLELDHGPFPRCKNVSGSSLGVKAGSTGCGNQLMMIFILEL